MNFQETNKKDAEVQVLTRKLLKMDAKRFSTLEANIENQRACKALQTEIGEMIKESNRLWMQEA